MCIYKPLAFSFVWFISVKHLNKVNITNSQASKVTHDKNTKGWISPDKLKFLFSIQFPHLSLPQKLADLNSTFFLSPSLHAEMETSDKKLFSRYFWCDIMRMVLLLPKTYDPTLSMRKTPAKPKLKGILQKGWPNKTELFKAVKCKASVRNSGSPRTLGRQGNYTQCRT